MPGTGEAAVVPLNEPDTIRLQPLTQDDGCVAGPIRPDRVLMGFVNNVPMFPSSKGAAYRVNIIQKCHKGVTFDQLKI